MKKNKIFTDGRYLPKRTKRKKLNKQKKLQKDLRKWLKTVKKNKKNELKNLRYEKKTEMKKLKKLRKKHPYRYREIANSCNKIAKINQQIALLIKNEPIQKEKIDLTKQKYPGYPKEINNIFVRNDVILRKMFHWLQEKEAFAQYEEAFKQQAKLPFKEISIAGVTTSETNDWSSSYSTSIDNMEQNSVPSIGLNSTYEDGASIISDSSFSSFDDDTKQEGFTIRQVTAEVHAAADEPWAPKYEYSPRQLFNQNQRVSISSSLSQDSVNERLIN